MQIRRLVEADHEALVAVRVPAFGAPGTVPGGRVEHPAFERWGLFLGAELVATATRKPYASWFSGQQVPTAGIAGVAIAPEHRGRGLLRPLMEHVLADARDQGDVVSTLFASDTGIYRSLGYRTVGAMDTIEAPATSLHGFRRWHDLRRATGADVPTIKRLYAEWACRHDGPLTRESAEFVDDVWLADLTAVTLVLDDAEEPIAYAGWNRSPGDGADAFVDAEDLIWTDPSALESLLWMFGTFSTVAPTIRFDTSGDELTSVLPESTVRQHRPYDLLVLRPEEFGPPAGPVLIRDYF